ncbi:MAG: ATP-dependent DNA helicase RecG, partial [Sediminibacterium sp.]|nr:ATP-dependent DNA helicase RecG [Sediminibacterium sp.]
MSISANILSTPIEYLKGVGPVRADLIKKELNIFTFLDLLEHFPIRHIDKTKVNLISDIHPNTDTIQVAGTLLFSEIVGSGRAKRLVAQIRDSSGILELAWFQGIHWVTKQLQPGTTYLVFGKTGFFNGKPQIVHPEIEVYQPAKTSGKSFLEPVYPST